MNNVSSVVMPCISKTTQQFGEYHPQIQGVSQAMQESIRKTRGKPNSNQTTWHYIPENPTRQLTKLFRSCINICSIYLQLIFLKTCGETSVFKTGNLHAKHKCTYTFNCVKPLYLQSDLQDLRVQNLFHVCSSGSERISSLGSVCHIDC
jgi:hypothetical protein